MSDFLWNLVFKPNGDFRWPAILLLLVIMIAFGIASAEFFYGDWKCAFAECRIQK